MRIKTSFVETPILIWKPGQVKSISLLVGFYKQWLRNLQRVRNNRSRFESTEIWCILLTAQNYYFIAKNWRIQVKQSIIVFGTFKYSLIHLSSNIFLEYNVFEWVGTCIETCFWTKFSSTFDMSKYEASAYKYFYRSICWMIPKLMSLNFSNIIISLSLLCKKRFLAKRLIYI